MNAIHNGRLYRILDDTGDGVQLEDGPTVDYGTPGLIIDPTDAEVAEVENLGAWYGLDGAELDAYRAYLSEGQPEPDAAPEAPAAAPEAAAAAVWTLTRPEVRAWLRDVQQQHLRLPRGLDCPVLVLTPSGELFQLDALITGAYRLRRVQP